MSWIFLTDGMAYKLKKPVHYDYLNFSTVALRKHYCEEEIRLNRRLAPEVYLGVIPLTKTPSGKIGIAGRGQVIDWLVKMRRLPADRMLDNVIHEGRPYSSDLRGVAELLTRFYQDAPIIALQPEEYRRRFRDIIEGNRQELPRYGSGISQSLMDEIAGAQLEFLLQHAAYFDRRVEGRRIVEAHGDLRPEHVYLGPPPQIIDCLEFARAFRILDAADELASLAMECERLGAPQVGAILFETYRRITEDDPPASLIAFYKSLRACLRGKLAIWHLRDPDVADPPKWRDRGKSYIKLAEQNLGSFA